MTATNQNSNNKRIAKNTILLYFRMIVTTIVSLYTARLTLQLLGVEEYGVYNVVAGIIGFMSIITGTMTSATQRFLAFDLGKQDIAQYRKTYSMLLNIFFIFSIIAVLFMEIIGPYCIQNYLVIPPDKLYAAQWVFQFTILNFVATTINIPNTASVVAYEKINIYAYFTFVDIFFKLLIVYVLYITPIDRLITLSSLTMLTSFVSSGILFLYCSKKLEGCTFHKCWDKDLFKRMSSYAGWNLFGSTSAVLTTQGQSIILNIFFGPLVNAAKAIADKINSIIVTFSTNFYMAVTPQIIKSYACGDIDYTRKLVTYSSRYSFYLLSVLSFPLIFNMEELLKLWLGEEQVSVEMIKFSQLELIKSLVYVLQDPITMAIRATGHIKKYQILVGIQTLMFLPICYLAFICGLPSYSSMLILAILYLLVQITRILLVRKVINISLKNYTQEVLVPITLTSAIISTACYFLIFEGNTFVHLVLNGCICLGISATIIYTIGLKKNERTQILQIAKEKLHIKHH